VAAAVAWGLAAAAAQGGGQVLSRPETGPVAASIVNEMNQALHRAEAWLAAQEPEPEEGDGAESVAAAEAPEALFWILEGTDGGADGDFFAAAEALARALDAAGAETVFLADGEPVAWRKALIRAVVLRQRVDPWTGGGYWAASRQAPAPEKIRTTRRALAALAAAGGEASGGVRGLRGRGNGERMRLHGRGESGIIGEEAIPGNTRGAERGIP